MKKQVWVLGLVFLIMVLGVTVAFGETTIIAVSKPDEMTQAQTTINANGGEYTINLETDIESSLSINHPNAKVTLVGNGHTLSTKTQAIVVSNGVLNLGDGKSELIIAYTGTQPDAITDGLVSVRGDSATCNMNNKVTIKDSKKDTILGAGVTVVLGGTFHMYGGTIQNCGIESGSVAYGGGVAVYAGGRFVMDGGVIDNCYVDTPYNPATDDDLPYNYLFIVNAGGGVFVSAGGNFTMNGGTIQNCRADYGGGVALVLSYNDEYRNRLGIIDSVITIENGDIFHNMAYKGGGIYVSGNYMANYAPIATYDLGTDSNSSTGLYVKGGNIYKNDAVEGGGIYLYRLRNEGKQHTQIQNATISGNTAAEGAGLMIDSFWTALKLEECIITGNKATQDENGNGGLGGGIMVSDNTSTSGTNMLGKNILCNNKADTMGADVYVDNNTGGNLIFNLTSASDMKRTYDSTGVFIDGWYDDTSPRWSIDKVCRSNTYLGDTFTGNYENGKSRGFIAAFTLNEIRLVKTWVDNNSVEKRPRSVTFTLEDAEGNPIKKGAYNATQKQWITSDEPAQITLTSDNVDSTNPSQWKGTIGPLLIDNYADPSKYRLYESGTGNFYQLKSGEPKIVGDSTSEPGVFLASFTNIACIPVSININWEDSSTLSRPQTLKVRLMINSEPPQVIQPINENTAFEVSADNNWSKTVYLPSGNYENLKAVAEDVTGYGYEQTAYESLKSPDGKFTFRLVNTRREFTVTFDLGDGIVISQQTVAEGRVASKPEDPVRAGYKFVQWMNGQEPYDFSKPVTQDLTLTAQWKDKMYTVNFETGGGDEIGSQTIREGKTATKPTDPKREGYRFVQWMNGQMSYDFSTLVTGDLTLTAQWEKEKAYKVIFETNGGNEIESQTIREGKTATKPTDPKRTGYTFVQWMNGQMPYDFSTLVTGDLTLTAQWEKEKAYKVIFETNGGNEIESQTIGEGKTAIRPADPVRTGYTFVQWMNGQMPYDFSTPVTGDLTLTARWKEIGEYYVAEGQESIWQKEDSQRLLFHIQNTVNDEKTYGKFTYIEIDGQKVEADTREDQMGGIIIELKPGFLETLSLGSHILRVYFSDGAVDVVFYVVQTEAINETLPDTGDKSNLLYWIGMAFIGAVGIIVLLKRRKRKS